MTTIYWTLSGTLNVEQAGLRADDYLGRPAATPEDFRDVFLEAAHSGDWDALRYSEIDGFSVQDVDDMHVHTPLAEWKISDTLTLPRRCGTCGMQDRDGTMK